MLRATRATRSRRVGIGEQIISISLFVVGVISYQQLAAPYCAGLPHTLPASSRALAGYPCARSSFQRTVYVLCQTPFVLHDIVRVKLADCWATIAVLALAVRMVAAFTMAPHVYCQAAPVTMYIERAIMPTFHIFMGPKHHPSTMALRCMFNTYAVFDVAFFTSLLGVWDVNIAVEVTYCLLAALAHMVLCCWHRDVAPGGPVNLAWQFCSRLLVMVTTLYLSLAHSTITGRRRRTNRTTSGVAAAAADGTAAAAGRHEFGVACHGPPAEKADKAFGYAADNALEEKQQQQQQQGRGSEGGGTAAVGQSCWGATAVTGQRPPVSTATVEGATRGGAQAGDEMEGGAVAQSTHPTDLEATNRVVGELMSYKSPIRRTVVRVKIPWADPDQLTPGFKQRLADLASQKGLVLRGTYVRSGCVELVLVLEALLPSSPSGTPGRGRHAGAHATTDDDGGELDVAAVIRGLGLEPPTPLTQQQHFREGDRVGGHGGSGVTAESRRVPVDVAAEYSLDDSGSGGCAPSRRGAVVLSLLPRVLPLPPRPEPDASVTHGSVSVTASAPTRSPCTAEMEPATPTALLSIRVRGLLTQTHSRPHSQQRQQPQDWNGAARAEEEPPPIEVLVRSAGKYLPARVARCRWAVDGTRGTTGPAHSPGLTDADSHDGGDPDERDGGGDTDGSGAVVGSNGYQYECQYDVELLAPPPAPGLVLVEVRRRKEDVISVPLPPGALGPADIAPSDVMSQLGGGSTLSDGIDLVPVLVTDDAAIAEEVNGLASSWPGGKDRELDGLLYDLGTWVAAAAAAGGFGAGDAAPATAAATVPATITATTAGSTPMTGKESQGGEEVGVEAALLGVLGAHLIEFVESAGLAATAAGIRTRIRPLLPLLSPPQLSQQQPMEKHELPQRKEQPDLDEERRLTNKTSGPAAGMAGVGGEFGTSCHRPGFGVRSEVRGGCRGMADGGWQFSLLASALLQVLGLQATTRSRAAAYNTLTGAWCVAQGQTVQLVECLALLCMLVRAGWSGLQPMGPTTIVCVMGCGISALMTLAWLVLPYRSWVRLARAVQIPRYLGHTAAKILVVLGFTAPLGMVTYTTGVGALLLEGLVLPGSCLISIRSAAILAAIKLPANAAMMLVLGATRAPLVALLLAARIEALALTTTIACNVYMRLACERHATDTAAVVAAATEEGEAGSGATLSTALRSGHGAMEEYAATSISRKKAV